jgi:hypothetical protein
MPVSSQWFANPSTGYTVNNSCVFDAASTAYMTKASTTPTLDTKCTFSTWLKRGQIDATSSSDHFGIFGHRQDADAANKNFQLWFYDDKLYCAFLDGGSTSFMKYTAALYRDVAAWYHIVLAVDSTDGTAADRVKLYVNGTRITSFTGTNTDPAEDETFLSTSCTIDVGRSSSASTTPDHYYFDGYMADVYYIDGTAYAASDFGETNDEGVWIPKSASGLTFGNNGFYLNFKDSSNLGNDANGGTDLSETNIASGDQKTDTPTNNQVTFNSLNNQRSGADSITEGLTVYNGPSTRTMISLTSNLPPTGKWAVAFSASVVSTGAGWNFGITKSNNSNFGDAAGGNEDVGASDGVNMSPSSSDLQLYDYSTSTSIDPTLPVTTSDEFWLAVDMATGKCFLGISNQSDSNAMIWVANDAGVDGNPATGDNPTATITAMIGSTEYTFAAAGSKGNSNLTLKKSADLNGTIPSGYTYFENISDFPAPAVTDPSTNFQTQLYTGNGTAIGSGGKAVTFTGNSSMQPDLVWIKNRSATDSHGLYDSVRGTTKQLESDTTAAETTESEGLTTFGSDGFTVGSLAQVNTNTENFVSWNWSAGNSGASNENGTINTTTTYVDTTAGISVSTYTGTGSNATVGHGLGVTPQFVFIKARDQSGQNWVVLHPAIANTQYLSFDSTSAATTSSLVWNDTSPTSTVVSIGTGGWVNDNTKLYVMYAFAEVAGFSKFSVFTGNGNADGPHVYTGFKPQLLIIKATTATEGWSMNDTAINPYNQGTTTGITALLANTNGAENQNNNENLDILSNGFKLKSTNDPVNSSNTYAYIAFAENPFGGDGVAPTPAR